MYTKNTVLTCGHCGSSGPMKILADYCERDMETIKSPCGYLVNQIRQPWGIAYELLLCLSCNGVTLRKVNWHDNEGPEDYDYTVLYPRDSNKFNNR